jgi:nucleotide-binding universal stress UspA family protein
VHFVLPDHLRERKSQLGGAHRSGQRNEHLAARQKLEEMYRGQLASCQTRLEQYWKRTAAELEKVATSAPAPAAFAACVLSGNVDSVVIFDDQGRVTYPNAPSSVSSDFRNLEGQWQDARQLEHRRAFDAELHLVHVHEIAAVPVFPAATIGYPGIGMPEMGMADGLPTGVAGCLPPDPPNEKKKSRLDVLVEDLKRSGRRVFAHQRDGTVVEEVLQTATEIAADLIVMGSHGHGSVYNLLVGSVTEGILKAGQRPVLLVPAPARHK